MTRIVVYGSGGAGKSTFASSLACRCGVTHIEIDLLAYDGQGVHVAQALLQQRFEEALTSDAWIVEGIHRDQLYRALPDAEAFVWLDYARTLVGRRLTARVLRQLIFGVERHGRATTLRSALHHELPFIRKTLKAHDRRRQHGQALADHAASLGVRVERVPSPRHARRLIKNGIP